MPCDFGRYRKQYPQKRKGFGRYPKQYQQKRKGFG